LGVRWLIQIDPLQKIPILSSCSLCKSVMKIHDLRPCTSTHGKGEQQSHYCIRNCRWCRTADFSTKCTKIDHITCWERHLPQEQEDNDPHEPVDPLQRLYVDAVTYSEKNVSVQEKLHEQDRIAQWFTIKSDSLGTGIPRLSVTDRFRHLCNPGALPNEYSLRQFPGFVSFIGDTGIGKSTLLRAMILMGHLDPSGTQYKEDETHLEDKIAGLRNALAQNAYGPVSRSGSTSQMTNPTSFGVHLYRDIAALTNNQTDGSQFSRDTPILFADCEGFRAGHALTNAELTDSRTPSPNLIIDLPITAKSYGKDGKDGIDLFYARFLYTVSDVVVLVMDGDTKFFPTMQRLVEWAASAVYRSVNHLAQKTLIIVRNMAKLDDEELYSAKDLKKRLLNKELPKFWETSPLLKDFVDNFNNKQNAYDHKIVDNNDLLKKFFSKVRACNVPDTRTAPLEKAFEQYQDLRNQIVDASETSQLLRSKNWMQYNVPMLSHILNHAFEHFRTSDKPFDFYQAARNDNPNPVSVSDHISNFIRHLHLLPTFPPEMIPEVIAICLVTWARRNFELGERIFPRMNVPYLQTN
jgi:energy-coupling factor transporter ATP-binding protein EcfA2